ncbi:hypothetical protein [Trichocoleus sp. FACHB-262]|uniref:hypothetical protein n=1 Tax=Trichocoleus sp. FACHB-262 TaxID=2692869 RepID=UPI0016848DFD|nr:hypothetical protein [Trichocoleus sp. FACHB-262]MBD2124754.1 hypothetical protein [Trichocoleus sp. FACHB-262]
MTSSFTEQLELKLWEDLKAASADPEGADIGLLLGELEAVVATVEEQNRLQVAAAAIEQMVQLYELRSGALLGDWEDRGRVEGPVVSGYWLTALVRQTMTFDLAQLLEPPVPEQRRRRVGAEGTGESVAGVVDKAVLLEALDEIAPTEASDPLAVAHAENVAAWSRAVVGWLERLATSRAVSLLELQQGLEMPLVEVWLGLLLTSEWHYTLEQRLDFYEPSGVWLKLSESQGNPDRQALS